ncbi:MAG: hypothetical protein WA140_10375 [Geobacteraceae bacterium]
MKCPKCGYNSFEFLDNCKKCGGDLGTFKKSFGLRGLAFSLKPTPSADVATSIVPRPESDARTKQLTEAAPVDILDWPPVEPTPPLRETGASPPGFDLGLTELQGARESTSPFGDDPLDAAGESSEGGGEGYGDFSFEETGNEFQSPQAVPDGQPLADDNLTDGEFEMEDFFIGEEPAVAENPVKGPTAPPQKQGKDEFDSLFGEVEDTGKPEPK